jgi:hypothetical protein
MGEFGGFQSADHENRFRKASLAGQIGSAARAVCGVRTRAGTVCQHVPLEDGKGRCLRHCGPHAAHAYRQRQLRQMRTGRTTPAEFALAEARRLRNALQWAWRKNPSLPGRTIDLRTHESTFLEAVRALGVDLAGLYPAQADWLRWRYQRTQIDRTADAAWTRAVRVALPKQIADADAAMIWVRLGSPDRRTKAGRALKAALRAGGEASAAKLALEVAGSSQNDAGAEALPTVPVWVAPAHGEPSKRGRPDRAKRPPQTPAAARARPLGRPRAKPEAPDEVAALISLYRASDSAVQRMFQAIDGDADRLAFLRALQALVDDPHGGSARRRWGVWLTALSRV